MAGRPPITHRWFLRLVQYAMDRVEMQSPALRSVLLDYLATPDLRPHERTLETLRRLVNVEIARVANAPDCDPLDVIYPQLYAISDIYGWTQGERVILTLSVLLNMDPDWRHLAANTIVRRDDVPHLIFRMSRVDIGALWNSLRTSALRESGLVLFESRDPASGMPFPEWIKPLDGLDEQALATSAGWRRFIEKVTEGPPRTQPVTHLPKLH